MLNMQAALVVDGFNPVIKVNTHKQNKILNTLIILPCLIKCKGLKREFSISVIIPKCKPDIAKT